MLDILFISNTDSEDQIPVKSDIGLGKKKNTRYVIDTDEIVYRGKIYRAKMYSEFGTGEKEFNKLQARYREYIKDKS